MRTKTTLLLLGLAAGLFGFIAFYELAQPGTREREGRDHFVLNFDRTGIDGIEIAGNEDKIELRRKGGQWELREPLKDRADQAVIAEILARSDSLQKGEELAGGELDKKKLREFGLSKPKLRLKLHGENAPPELLFGKETAVEGRIYVRLEDSNTVYVVSGELRDLIARKPDDFRDRRLTDVEGAHVNRLALKTPAGEIELVREGEAWEFKKPLKARASEKAVTDLIGSILNTEILAFRSEKGADALGEVRGTVTLSAASREKKIRLEIGASDTKTGDTFARLSTRGSVYLLPRRVERILSLTPNDLRDRHLLRVEFDIVDRITIEPAGKPPLVLQRRQEAWTVKEGSRAPGPANGASVQALVRALQAREVSAFVADVASDLPKYGLDRPQLRVTFSSYASEPTAEGKAGEEPIATLVFGSVDGENVYAMLENEPFVVAVDKSILQEIAAGPAAWRTLSVFRFKPEEITALTVTGVTGAPLSLVREGAAWKIAKGEGTLNAVHLESLLNTLANLSAIRRVDADLTEASPATRTFTFKTADGGSHTLLLGSPLPDGTFAARVEGESGTVILSAPDESALRLPLVSLE